MDSSPRMVLFPVSLDELQELIESCVQKALEKHSNNGVDLDTIMDSAEICQEFGISLPTLIKYRKEGLIPFFNIGNRVRFKRRDLIGALGKISRVWRQGK